MLESLELELLLNLFDLRLELVDFLGRELLRISILSLHHTTSG